LKAILVIIAVLAVPLAMTVSGNPHLAVNGPALVIPVRFGCIGYLLGRWRGAAIGVLLAFITMCFVIPTLYELLMSD